jgi:hypothetical protein
MIDRNAVQRVWGNEGTFTSRGRLGTQFTEIEDALPRRSKINWTRAELTNNYPVLGIN